MKKEQIKRNIIKFICIIVLLISIGLQTVHAFSKKEDNIFSYEYINIKDIAQVEVSEKKESESIIDKLLTAINNDQATEVDIQNNFAENELSPIKSIENTSSPKAIWYLPTEIGRITQNPSYGHVAYDITSFRGSQETIFPVANGVVSGIYTDNAGALVVTVLHDINGKKYTSQYAHLSRYAQGLHVGQEVTINDSLGCMGTTGYSTGIHLHLAVMDCALFDPNDPYCRDLNGFFHYGKTRFNQGFFGLGALMYVPAEWNSR